MGTRDSLHSELLMFIPNAYFQPPSNVKMKYPCIVYNKIPAFKTFGNNAIYSRLQGYSLTVIEKDPDSDIADRLEDHFDYCSIAQHYIVDNLHHTILNLYY